MAPTPDKSLFYKITFIDCNSVLRTSERESTRPLLDLKLCPEVWVGADGSGWGCTRRDLLGSRVSGAAH